MPSRNQALGDVPVGDLLDQVAASLRCMGDTAGEVHWTLLRLSIRGIRGATTFANPVLRYLLRRRDHAGDYEIPFHSQELIVRLDRQQFTLLLPLAVTEFLERFHEGLYPNIEVS